MMTTSNIHELNILSELLAGGLGTVTKISGGGLPLEVIQALEAAREQMSTLPEVLTNFRMSMEKYDTVSAAITRMIELAHTASRDISDEDRLMLNDEFVGLAKILAADAGRHFYPGPRLNLNDQGQAMSAAKIIGYMKPFMATTGQNLYEHQKIIQKAVNDTISFLTTITECYPESEGATHLALILSQTGQTSLATVPHILH